MTDNETKIREDRLHERMLILRYQAGEEAVFADLIAPYHGPLTYFVRRLTKDPVKAEDILQDVWVKVLKHLRTLRNPEAFRVWLYQIARRQAWNQLRSDKKSAHPLVEDVASAQDGPEELAFTAEQAPMVHQCLAALRPEHREVLLLRFIEDMPYESIAEVVGCGVGTVRSRLFYAKQALRREMEKEQGWMSGFVRRF